MTQLRVKELLGRANSLLDSGFSLFAGRVLIKSADLENILDRIDASLPEDIRDAEKILRAKEQHILEAQQQAERIIQEAKREAEKILSESELLNQVQRQAEKLKEQVYSECNELRNKTLEEVNQIKMNADDEARRIKEGAENYAEQILNNIDSDLTQLHQIVKNGQLYLEKMKASSNAPETAYAQQQPQYEEEYASSNYPM